MNDEKKCLISTSGLKPFSRERERKKMGLFCRRLSRAFPKFSATATARCGRPELHRLMSTVWTNNWRIRVHASRVVSLFLFLNVKLTTEC